MTKSATLVLILATLGLIGCQGEQSTTTEPVEPASTAESAATQPSTEVDHITEPDPAQAEALVSALRESQLADPAQARLSERENLREQMRERRETVQSRRGSDEEATTPATARMSPRTAWWEDERLVEQLALQSNQAEHLARASAELENTRTRTRQALTSSQRELVQALSTGESERARDLVEQRKRRSMELTEAEAEWMRNLIDILDGDQLSTLISNYPQLMLAGAGRPR
ncbi:MAG: hypothetical protein EA370_03330 [Wenzhouxiangella sp.]|nr:MAG: hypothetical protein EA370_03330 [Wenzhouxiangella sp.]